jgi:hypothetical protein
MSLKAESYICTRIFMTLPEEGHIDVAVCLCTHLKKLMTSDGNLVEMNAVIVVIGCCFDNFPIGVHAVTLRSCQH